jgi:predicted Zn-dependent peptidase
MDDIRHLSRADIRSYFRRYYGPNNAVVVVAGDVDPRRIRRWARRYLGGVPRGEAPPPVRSAEPPQRGQRRVEVVFDAEPSLRMGWKVPSASSEDAPPLYMLMSILTGGRNSRLYSRLVLEDRIASGVSASIEPGRLYPGLFSIQASPLHPHSTREVELAIQEELDRLRHVPPSEREVQQVRNQLEASQIRRLRSNFGLALQLAEAASLSGHWKDAFESTRELMEVTPDDVQRVVRRYFRKEHMTVATLVRPEGEAGGGR